MGTLLKKSLIGLTLILGLSGPVLAEKHILIVSGHPHLERSSANKTILDELHKRLPQAEILYLDKIAPDYRFDVKREQQRIRDADIIVMQFPIYWYSPPALMKKWQEDMLTYGFAHDASGGLLKGKQLVLSFTTGAGENEYRTGGRMNYPIDAFLPPLQQFGNLSGFEWQGYVYSGGYSVRADDAQKQVQQGKAKEHAAKLAEKLSALAQAPKP